MKNTDGGKERGFSSIYLKFESLSDCAFSTEVTFPEEDEKVRRRKQVEAANVSILGGPKKDSGNDENSDAKGRMVVATHFKRKIGREVKEIIDDKQSRVELYKKIHNIKRGRREANI